MNRAAVANTRLTVATASIRDLGNHFSRLEQQLGHRDVIITDEGQPKRKLALFVDRQTTAIKS
jgi:hypothetical protein